MRYLLIFLFIPFSSFGQSYTPLDLDTSSYWHHKYFYYTGINGFSQFNEATYLTEVLGDTTINGFVYQILESYIIEAKRIEYPQSMIYGTRGYLREDTAARKIFGYVPGGSGEKLLLDFSLGVSDTVKIFPYRNNLPPTGIPVLIDSVKNVNYLSQSRRTLYFDWLISGNSWSNFMIEGVGAHYQFPWDISGGEWIAPGFVCQCFKSKGNVQYLNTDEFPQLDTTCPKLARWPLSTSNIKQTAFQAHLAQTKLYIQNGTAENLHIELFNLNGQRMEQVDSKEFSFEKDFSRLPKGIYLVEITSSSGRQVLKMPIL